MAYDRNDVKRTGKASPAAEVVYRLYTSASDGSKVKRSIYVTLYDALCLLGVDPGTAKKSCDRDALDKHRSVDVTSMLLGGKLTPFVTVNTACYVLPKEFKHCLATHKLKSVVSTLTNKRYMTLDPEGESDPKLVDAQKKGRCQIDARGDVTFEPPATKPGSSVSGVGKKKKRDSGVSSCDSSDAGGADDDIDALDSLNTQNVKDQTQQQRSPKKAKIEAPPVSKKVHENGSRHPSPRPASPPKRAPSAEPKVGPDPPYKKKKDGKQTKEEPQKTKRRKHQKRERTKKVRTQSSSSDDSDDDEERSSKTSRKKKTKDADD